MKESSQKVPISVKYLQHVRGKERGPHSPSLTGQGTSTALQAFCNVAATLRDSALERVMEHLTPGGEPTVVRCSVCEGCSASFHVPSQSSSLPPCNRGIVIPTLGLWKLRPLDENSFTQSNPANGTQCTGLCSLLHSAQSTHLASN